MSRFFFLFLLFIWILPSVAGAGDLPVRFVVENDRAREAADRCHQAWQELGPEMIQNLAPHVARFDTVTCFLMESSSFAERFGGAAPDWGVGLAFPGGQVVAIDYARLPAVGRGLREVFLHEMVHAVLFQAVGEAWLPTWFHEGCAMRYSGEWRFSDTVSLVLDGHVPSLDNLQGRFPALPATADRAYRTSLLAVNRLEDQYGPGAAGRIIEAVDRLGNFSLAFAEVTGAPLDLFIADFASAMRLRLGWLVILTRWPTLFVLLSAVLLVGALRKFLRARRRLAEMEEEEEGV